MSLISLFNFLIDIITYSVIISWIVKICYFIYSFFIRKPCSIITKYGADSWALISDGTSEVGKELTLQLAKEGFNLFIIGKDTDLLNAVSKEIRKRFNVKVEFLTVDLSKYTKYEEYRILFEEYFKNKSVNILVNNIGIYYNESFKQISLDQTLKTVTLNCYPQVYLTKLFIQNLKGSKGGIISLSSLAANIYTSKMNVYSATKRFNHYISKGLSLEEKNLDIISVKLGTCENGKFGFEIQPLQYIKGIFADFTYEKETNGCLIFKIQEYLISCLPSWIVTIFAEYLTSKDLNKTNYNKEK